ncbi:HD domain-containing protein [Fluviicola taffensis]|uniref:Metal dependent phosphohydrolase n=1 Tax=Fluviicola taffensis (strain DSM 16823 / NCIMB 13979 / RW262) TaxID=755732 RepID=F2IHY4_FLUTR|nr:HD domain-containing protein [Fluviicola taffensis]AEA45943.1 metal dependent phosphohydrolase [Fluviicola taffensis DSM 16823]
MNLLEEVKLIVEQKFRTESADHDWYHIERVLKLAEYIQSKEGGDLLVIQLAALLHDISDHKLNGGIKNDCGRVSREMLTRLKADEKLIGQVCEIVDNVSFKGAGVEDVTGSIELDIVRDADRLDAIGAIGIARAFHYGGKHDRSFYEPNLEPTIHANFDAYSSDKSHTLNHFYEKLFLIKDRLRSKTAQEIGSQRHDLMAEFVASFLKEWNVNLK